jgi:serine/threonine-protein kinase PknG
LDPFDWRVIWYRGVACIAQKKPEGAVNAFETCYSEVPGELAVKLAIAVAAELAGDVARAVKYYDCVARTDTSYGTAVFGLGRCLANQGKREDAVTALARIATSSSLYSEAQKAIARVLISELPQPPGPDELARASATLEALMLDSVERFQLACAVFDTAQRLLNAARVKPAPSIKLFGRSLDDRSIALGLEHAYRNLAKLTDDEKEKLFLVDLANQVRPKTIV